MKLREAHLINSKQNLQYYCKFLQRKTYFLNLRKYYALLQMYNCTTNNCIEIAQSITVSDNFLAFQTVVCRHAQKSHGRIGNTSWQRDKSPFLTVIFTDIIVLAQKMKHLPQKVLFEQVSWEYQSGLEDLKKQCLQVDVTVNVLPRSWQCCIVCCNK